MFRDRSSRAIREFGTPERVYALTRHILSGPKSRKQLEEGLGLFEATGTTAREAFGYTLDYAEDLDLVSQTDDVYRLRVPPEEVSSVDSFRRFSAKVTLSRNESPFFQITSTILALNDGVLSHLGWSELAQAVNKKGVDVKEHNLLGWRFWASFFGLGYVHGIQFIPNAFTRIRDVLSQQRDLPIDQPIDIQRFVAWLESACPELVASRNEDQIGLAVSSGLRVLQHIGLITMVDQPDAIKMRLFCFAGESINEVSHIRVKGGIG